MFQGDSSYQFGFDVNDDLNTNYQNRKEQRDGNKISGSYSVVDSDGFIRTVTYTADPKEGFKAEVNPLNCVGFPQVFFQIFRAKFMRPFGAGHARA